MVNGNGMNRSTMWVIGLLAGLFFMGLGGSYAFTSKMVTHREMDSKYEILLHEVRELRAEVKYLRDEVIGMKSYFRNLKK